MAQAAHKRVHRRTASGLSGILHKPLAKSYVQRLVTGARDQAGLLDQGFLGA
jgi:hypothetical protein